MLEEGEPPIIPQRVVVPQKSSTHINAQAGNELQIKTILVPLDFSRSSMQALKCAIPLAEDFRAAIHLAYVQPADEMSEIPNAGRLMRNSAAAVAAMEDRLAGVRRKHSIHFWPDTCHVASGRPFAEICKLARKTEADLIVMSTRGHSGLRHLVLGSTTERVVRYAPCPVLVPRGTKYRKAIAGRLIDRSALRLRRILVPVDFSRCSLVGVDYAARLAKSTEATLRLVHVVFPYGQGSAIDRIGASTRPLIDAAKTAAETNMSELTGMPFMHGVSCETEIRVGSAIDEICFETRRSDIDLVVTSTHGRAGFKRALLGSVAEHVVRYAECPVLIVPSRGCY